MMRPDAKVKKVYLYPKPVDLRKIHQWPGRTSRTRYRGSGVRPGAFRLPQQAAQPREDTAI